MLDPHELKKFLCILNDANVSYFVSGGVGLDGLRGKLTRKHKDIDVYMFKSDLTRLFKKLKTSGYRCFRKLNKFEIQGNGILVDILPLVNEKNMVYLKGNIADTRFPKEIFENYLEGKLDGITFRVAPGEIFALEMPYSKHPEDKKYAASLSYNKLLFKRIRNIQKESPPNIILEEI